MKVLIIINDAPYGTEKAYNALRLAMGLQEESKEVEVRLFLLSDAVTCTLPGHQRPQGSYHIEQMLQGIIGKGAKVRACVSCIDARGLWAIDLIEGIEISSISDLARWVLDSDRVITF